MEQGVDETSTRSDLADLPLVGPERIDDYKRSNPEDYASNDYTSISLTEAVKKMLSLFGEGAYYWRGVSRRRYDDALELVKYFPGAGENGVVAVRCGEDEFILHKWINRD